MLANAAPTPASQQSAKTCQLSFPSLGRGCRTLMYGYFAASTKPFKVGMYGAAARYTLHIHYKIVEPPSAAGTAGLHVQDPQHADARV